MEKLYYTIGEVALILGESTSLVRFWSNSFEKYIKPHRNAKGNRLYTADDIELLKQVYYLVKIKGMTLSGAAVQLDTARKAVSGKVKAIESLKEIRSQLLDIRKNI